jgi:hypothetical protein
MAWNTARVSLLSPGWRSVEVEQTIDRRSFDGQRVRVIGVERDNGVAEPVRLKPVREWLEARGLAEQESIRNGARLARQDVEADLFEADGELTEVLLTFVLSRDCPQHWPDWQRLVSELCDQFGFQLADFDTMGRVPAAELFRLLAGTSQWQEFDAQFHWLVPPGLRVPGRPAGVP